MYQLVKPFIQSRSLNSLTILVTQKIELVIGKRQWDVEGEAVGSSMSEEKEDAMYVYQIWRGQGIN